MRTLTGNVHKLGSDEPAEGVYVRVACDGDPRSHGGWTYAGGLFVIQNLPPSTCRLQIALAEMSTALVTVNVDTSKQSYAVVAAPL